MSFSENLNSLLKKYNDLEQDLSKGAKELGNSYAKISKEYSDLTEIVNLIKELRSLEKNQNDLTAILDDTDEDLKALAAEELPIIKEKTLNLTEQIKIALLPKDADDSKNVILEIRAGTGGEEAALFAASLFRMYQRYVERKHWKLEIISFNETGKGGYKEIICEINGKMAFSKLKFESGVHRVQRIPDTETNGRVHTSAATVAVLPEALDVDIKIDPNDLRIDVYRASGAGGQHVNTTDSAVRITHIPTGVVVTQQDEKSQHKNKARAMKILMARLYEQQKLEQEQERSSARKNQVGSGDRSARIRTYNFPQGRITDHRVNYTAYNLDDFMDGNIDELIDSLISFDQSQKLAEEGL
ncbi:peptide chain release factor 1 [Rickettsiales bacterium LUAb2]